MFVMQGTKQWISVTVAVVAMLTVSSSFAKSADQAGHKIYANNCAGCHSGGKNMMMPDKPVIGSKKLSSKAEFKEFLLKPAGSMPAFASVAKNDTDLSALYTYCKSLK